VLAAAVALAAPYVAAQDPAAAAPASRVVRVTLYRGQALVTRQVTINAGSGAREVVVGDLPQSVEPASLFAEGSQDVEIRAVRYRARAVGEEPREEVRRLDQAIQELNDRLAANRKAQEMLAQRAAYLDKLEGFVAPTAQIELSKGVLNSADLEKLTLFVFEQRKQIGTEQLTLQHEARDLQQQLDVLTRQRNQLTAGATRDVREAVLFVEKRAEGPTSVLLNYLVGNCGWTPSYTFRGEAGKGTVRVEYNALISQMTGEDWSDVELVLSTASPSLNAQAPGLAPFHVTLTSDPAPMGKASKEQLADAYGMLRREQQEAQQSFGQAMGLSPALDSNWRLNSAANELQNLELLGGLDVLRSVSAAEADAPSISYQIASPVSLASRADQQMVRILDTSFPASFYFVATPVLTSYVFREAELANNSQEDLLAGPITVYLNDRFVGRGEITTVARGQTFLVGFGADPQLRCRRELAHKTESVQGGNREMTFRYRIVLENYKPQPVTVRVLDRLPYSDRETDVRVTLSHVSDPLSENPLYLRLDRGKGILRWDVDVPASAAGSTARLVEYEYKVEFDRSMHLAAPAGAQQQEEFKDLQLQRMTR
jgi:uncharacterized protein (TIGR02231 family)